MLKKLPGSVNVQKLRAIKFNSMHEIVFNWRVMQRLELKDEIPSEIIRGYRNQSAIHLALSKKLIADISNMQKLSVVTVCADATNCCNLIAHSFASLHA